MFYFVLFALFIFTYKNTYEIFYSVASYTTAAWFFFLYSAYEIWCICNIGAWANEADKALESDEDYKKALLADIEHDDHDKNKQN